jgi:hypothetical protein
MPEDRRTVWTCRVDASHTVRLEDIPIEQLDPLQQECEETWFSMVITPLARRPATILALYRKCCEVAGVEPRPVVTAREAIEMFDLTDDDRPTMYSGGLPDPKAEDRTTVG